MRTVAKQATDFCKRCGGLLHVIRLEESDDGVWVDVTKCEMCRKVSGGSAGEASAYPDKGKAEPSGDLS